MCARLSKLSDGAKAAYFLCAVIIGVGISELHIWTSRTVLSPESEACGVFPNTTTLLAKKQLSSVWRFKYAFQDGISGSIERRCPSLQGESDVFVGGLLVCRSNIPVKAPTFGSVVRANVEDCHGNVQFVMRSGSAWTELINGITRKVGRMRCRQGTAARCASTPASSFRATDPFGVAVTATADCRHAPFFPRNCPTR